MLLINVGKVFKKRHPYLFKNVSGVYKSPFYCTKSRKWYIFAFNLSGTYE